MAATKIEYIYLNLLQVHWNLALRPEDYAYSSISVYELGHESALTIVNYTDYFWGFLCVLSGGNTWPHSPCRAETPDTKNFAHEGLTNAETDRLNNVIRYVKRISYGLIRLEHPRLSGIAQAIWPQKKSKNHNYLARLFKGVLIPRCPELSTIMRWIILLSPISIHTFIVGILITRSILSATIVDDSI